MGDPHPVRAAGLDAGLDGRADVVDVHVHVPQPLAADHDERVAERGEGVAQCGDAVVVGVEEVHHLVGGSVLGEAVAVLVHLQGARLRDVLARRGVAPSGERRLRGVEQDDDPAAAGVDHAGPAQHVELLGRAGECLAGGGRGGGERVAGTRALGGAG